jgi:hypothetical protein
MASVYSSCVTTMRMTISLALPRGIDTGTVTSLALLAELLLASEAVGGLASGSSVASRTAGAPSPGRALSAGAWGADPPGAAGGVSVEGYPTAGDGTALACTGVAGLAASDGR